jgi:cyclase
VFASLKKLRPRIIPILLLKNSGLYKTTKFKDPKYIGDPINAIRIFNEKEVDELVFLDITKSYDNTEINWNILKDIATECFMPLTYGGGIRSVEMIREVLNIGVEKVSLNTNAVKNPEIINKAAGYFGNSTIVVSIDVKKNIFGKYEVFICGGKEKTKLNPLDWAREVERRGAGEILINSIDNDGVMNGYDFNLIKIISSCVNIPIVAAGGAKGLLDFKSAITDCNASGVAGGACFVYQGKHRAVLITYPSREEINKLF